MKGKVRVPPEANAPRSPAPVCPPVFRPGAQALQRRPAAPALPALPAVPPVFRPVPVRQAKAVAVPPPVPHANPVRPPALPAPIQMMRVGTRLRKQTESYSPGASGMEAPIKTYTTKELKEEVPDFDDGRDGGTGFHAGMRLSGAAHAASYMAYHALDLATLGLASDAFSYVAATRRSSAPLHPVRAVAGFVGTAAAKGAAAYGVLYGAGAVGVLGTAAGAAGTAAAMTRAGQWAYSWVDSTVAWLGKNNRAAQSYERHVLGETIQSTGQVTVQAAGTRSDANALMGESASEHAGRLRKTHPGSRHHYEWLHLLGRSLGGQMIQDNFVAGSYHANTEMIPLESAISEANEATPGMQVNITAFCEFGTRIAKRINYKVYSPQGRKLFDKTIDAQRGPVSSLENKALQEAARAALAGGVYGAVRRVAGPR